MTDQVAELMPFFRVTEWLTLSGRGLMASTTMDRDRTRTSASRDLIGHTVALSVQPGAGGESGLYKVKGVEMFCIEEQRAGIAIGLLVEKVDGTDRKAE